MKTRTRLLLVAVALAGCADRSYLTPSHGRSFREMLARQTVNPGGSEGRALKGLDSQEAAQVTDVYRRQLGGGQGASAQQQILMFSPQTAAAPYVPPPSVTPGR